MLPQIHLFLLRKKVAEYVQAGSGFRKFYFALGASAETISVSENDNGDDVESNETVVKLMSEDCSS